MLNQLLARLPNFTPVLMALGFVVILLSLWMPVWSGHRVARNERRAGAFTEAILIGGLASQPFAFDSRPDAERILAAIREACTALRVPESTVPELEPGELHADALFLLSKHHRFLLTRRPAPDGARDDYDPNTFELLEAYGWPRSATSPGQTAFYHGERDRSSFTRNLIARYVGDDHPRGGDARVFSRFDDVNEKHHRGAREERWLHDPIEVRINQIAARLMRVAKLEKIDGAMDRELGERLTTAIIAELDGLNVWQIFQPTFLPEFTTADRLVWGGRQYLFCLLRRAEGEERPLEVYAWPREDLHPPGLVIYYPQVGEPAVSGNSSPEYFGTEAAPKASSGVWRDVPTEKEQSERTPYYLGENGGRWCRYEDFKLVRLLVNER